ncbi:MAG: transporter substrate-binding domain-containing protein [Candidatus Pelethousia sp.]|nr:transporter substrate-binding domain-containing protein [Candidatus Pelethousia sp.]
MKKIALALALLMLATLVLGCAQPAAAEPAPAEPAAAEPAAEEAAPAEPAAEDDLAYVTSTGKLKIGITIFSPMNYYDDNGKLVGFETEFSTALCEKLGVTPEFIEINWDTKEVELAAKNIDCIWNGLTVTEERKENIGFSDSYIKNMQVVVIKADKADTYKDTASLASANLVAEVGSAGESAIQADESLKSASYTAVPKQADALMEVKAGTADAAVIDYVMAKAMVGEGTDYSELMILPNLELAVEEYAIGFRVGSNIIPKANEIIAELIADGTLDSIAATYGLTDSLLSNQ